MQVVSLEPEIRWIPQWSVDKQVTMSGKMRNMKINYYVWIHLNEMCCDFFFIDY